MSSAPHIAILKGLLEEILDILGEPQSFPIPAPPDPQVTPQVRLKTLVKVKKSLEYEFEEANRLLSELKSTLNGLLGLRAKLTGKERELDNTVYQDFSDEHDFVDIKKNLNKYVRKLVAERNALDEEIQTLEDQIAATAPVIPPRLTPPQWFHSPPRDGDIANWFQFWDQFKVLVHNIDPAELPPVLKFHHLISCLRGRALQSVGGLPVEYASYPEAVNILKSEFGRPTAVKQALYHQLTTLPNTNGENINFRNFLDNLEKILIQLQKLGEPVDTLHVRSSISKKLPPFLLDLVYESENMAENRGETWSTDKMRKVLKDILHRREKTSETLAQAQNEGGAPKNYFKKVTTPASHTIQGEDQKPTLAFTTQTAPHQLVAAPSPDTRKNLPPRYPCVFCGEMSHWSSNCSMDRPARIRKLQELKKCFRCLKEGHLARDCLALCGRCVNGLHHRVLCPSNQPRQQQSPAAARQTSTFTPATSSNSTAMGSGSGQAFGQLVQNKPPVAMNFTNFVGQENSSTTPNPFPYNYTVVSMAHQHCLPVPRPLVELKAEGFHSVLKCTWVKVFNPNIPSLEKEILVVFDDGSFSTFVSSRLADTLNLKCWGEKQLQLAVFNDPQVRMANSAECSIGLKLSSMDLVIPVTKVDYLTQQIPYVRSSPSAQTFLESQQNWQIGTPDLLIGSDFYHEFGLKEISQHFDGFRLFSSELGNVVGGRGRTQSDQSPALHFHIIKPYLTVTNPWQSAKIPKPADSLNLFDDFLTQEMVGIKRENSQAPKDLEIAQFRTQLKWVENRYQVELPWVGQDVKPPVNFPLAWGRLKSLVKRLQENPQLLEKYSKNISDQLSEGIVSVAPKTFDPDHPLSYLPHQAVVREDKGGKLRVVFDASAQVTPNLGA
uniref:CCHC-type domain-containing protein n=2 Tax=Ditylenchus dipsaci TaxID=166011 RepID=A0A915DQR5_9BILA